MTRTAKTRTRKPVDRPHGRKLASAPRRPRPRPNLLQRLILRLGKTLVGVLPRARRIRAANDPEA